MPKYTLTTAPDMAISDSGQFKTGDLVRISGSIHDDGVYRVTGIDGMDAHVARVGVMLSAWYFFRRSISKAWGKVTNA